MCLSLCSVSWILVRVLVIDVLMYINTFVQEEIWTSSCVIIICFELSPFLIHSVAVLASISICLCVWNSFLIPCMLFIWGKNFTLHSRVSNEIPTSSQVHQFTALRYDWYTTSSHHPVWLPIWPVIQRELDKEVREIIPLTRSGSSAAQLEGGALHKILIRLQNQLYRRWQQTRYDSIENGNNDQAPKSGCEVAKHMYTLHRWICSICT